MISPRVLTKLVALGAVAGAGALAWANYETRLYTQRRFEVPVLPAGQPDFKILHISDLHLTPKQEDKIAWVRGLAELEPDFVINTGDNMAHLQVMPALKLALEPLTRFPGAFVMGSNDYYSPKGKNPARYLLPDPRVGNTPRVMDLPWEELRDFMTGHGWLDLTNVRTSVNVGGLPIEFSGVDDPHLDRDVYPAPAMEGLAIGDPHVLRIGVTHAPYVRVLDQMHQDSRDLIIAGHTHGGQLCIPGYGALVTNCDLDQSRAKGLNGWPGARPDAGGTDSTWLHVSAGLGTSPYAPVRFACLPEATLLTLTARQD